MISKRAHRVLDYFTGCALIASPYLFGMGDISSAREVFLGAGLVSFVNVFLFGYSTKLHMKIDLLNGAFLISAPSIFSYKLLLSNTQYGFHVGAGFLIILLVGETRYRREDSIAASKVSLEVGHIYSKSS